MFRVLLILNHSILIGATLTEMPSHEPQLRPTTPALSSIRSIFIRIVFVFGITTRRKESDLRPLHGVND